MRWFLLFIVICFIFSFTSGEETQDNESTVRSGPKKFQFPRRKFLRRRLQITEDDGKPEGNVTTSMSMSVSKSATGPAHSGPSSEPVKSRPLLFSRLNRPKLIFNKNRSGSSTTLQVPRAAIPTSDSSTNQEVITETPSNTFKPKARPSFGKPPTNRPIVKATLRKLYRPSVKTTASTTTEVDDTIIENEEALDNSPVSTTTVHKSTTTDTTSLEPQTTTTTATTEVSSTTEVPSTASKTTPKNMIIIPVPPSQRKPYHPVIMQVTKTPSVSSTEKPQTRVVTYKLNKMFVPLGIYGKVLPKSEISQAAAAAGGDNANTETGENGEDGQDLYVSSTTTSAAVLGSTKKLYPSAISPAIRHKGTSSEELQTSDDSSRDFAAAIQPSTIPLTEVDAIFREQQWHPFQSEKGGNKQKKGSKQFFDASQVDLTMNYKPDITSISLTTQKPRIEQISLTTTEMPFYLSTSGSGISGITASGSDNTNRRENYKNQNTMTQMGPPRPFDRPSPPKSLVESIKSAAANAASSIPGLIHGGLSHLSILSNQFDDGSLFGATVTSSPSGSISSPTNNKLINNNNGQQSSILGSASNTGSVTIGAPDEETLEYFRKRPHLISGNSFSQPHYSSGFKPGTVSPHFAKAYYASTTTTATPSPSPSSPTPTSASTTDRIRSTTVNSAYEPTYEFHKPSLLLRSPKNFQDWKDAYVDQLIESSNRYKYTTTPSSPFESELIRHHWNEINNKYTKNEIDDAKDKIYQMFSGPTPPSIEEMLYMRPPHLSHLSRSSSNSALSDLLKMFRIGFSIGSTSTRKPFSRSFGTLRSSSVSDHDGWRPIKPGGEPFVSFNAGITFATPKPTSHPGSGGSHFSSSSRPYIPKPFRNLKSGPPSYSHVEESYSQHAGTSPSHSSIHYSPSKYARPSPSSPLTSDYSHTYYSEGDKDFGENGNFGENGKYEENNYKAPSDLSSLYESDPGLELIPSSVFYKQKEAGVDMGEIRAILKPSGTSDQAVKSQFSQDVSNIPQISFPDGKMPQQFQTLGQLQEYFGTAEPTQQNQVHFQPPLLKLIQQSFDSTKSQVGLHQQAGLLLNQPVNHIHQGFGLQQNRQPTSAPTQQQQHHYYQPQQQQSIPPQFSQFGHSLASLAQNNQHVQYSPALQSHQSHRVQNHHQQQQQQFHHQSAPVKATGDSGLGFSDFELPAGVDPDIAALLKAELDKDDIPAEFRKEFQEQEKAKQQKAQQQQHRPTQSTPQRRADGSNQLKAIFHKPIPINPTSISPAKGRMPPGKIPPGVPRYVIELARKLRNDKNLQGIVRVTSKKEGGVPVEYLYPVRG